MNRYDNHEPGDALWVMLLFFITITVIGAIGVILTS